MADQALGAEPRARKSYTRTAADRAAIGERNRLNKRKYPEGYDTKSRLYRIWRAMHFRCFKPSHEAFPRYGGRGITVCPEWRTDYPVFLEWALANGYAPTLTIDRKDNDLGYEPGNCRWATVRAQMLSTRHNAPPLTIGGETKAITEWADDPRCRVSRATLYKRLARGFDPERAVMQPVRRRAECT